MSAIISTSTQAITQPSPGIQGTPQQRPPKKHYQSQAQINAALRSGRIYARPPMPEQSQPGRAGTARLVIETGKEDDFLGDLSKVSAKISILEQLKKSQPHREMLNRFLGEHYAGKIRAGNIALMTALLLITFGPEDFASHALKGCSYPLYLTI